MADREKTQRIVQHVISLVLMVAALSMLGWLSVRYKVQADWTAGNRNTLTEGSRRLLKAMPDPIRFTIFAPPNAGNRRDLESQVQRYQRFKKNIRLEFVDPSANPKRVREENISAVGEAVVEYQGRKEHLNALSEPAITAALQRLSYSGETWVVFLEGHGERSISGDDPTALGRFAQTLRDKGLKLRALNLVRDPKIPDNTSVLVIPSPTRAPLEGEVKLIKDYLDRGGNLLWLADPDNPAGMQPLADALGIAWQNGYAVFPDYQILGLNHPGYFLATEYPATPITQQMTDITVFPLARSLTWKQDSGWNAQPFLRTGDRAWLETGPLTGEIGFDPNSGDIPGPLTIGLELTRDVKVSAEAAAGAASPVAAASGAGAAKAEEKQAETQNKQQRVALVGDSDFLANPYVEQLGNTQLGLNLIQWLAAHDTQINVNVPRAPDIALTIPRWGMWLIAPGFVLVLPLVLLGFGVARWAVRRRR